MCDHSSTPMVSIIIPVYNGSNYLNEAIDSALAQTYPNCEIIVVNDGSDDGGATEMSALSYGSKIRYISKKNGGTASALNVGLDNMRGSYFSWLSHDDLYLPDKIACQMAFLSTTGDPLAVSFSAFRAIDQNGTVLSEHITPDMPFKAARWLLLAWSSIHGCSLLIPRQGFDRAGRFNENLSTTQDYDMWLRLTDHCNFYNCGKILVSSRQHPEQGSRKIDNHLQDVTQYKKNNAWRITTDYMKDAFGDEGMTTAYHELIRRYADFHLFAECGRFIRQLCLAQPSKANFRFAASMLKKIAGALF